jgi:hypothetical protein
MYIQAQELLQQLISHMTVLTSLSIIMETINKIMEGGILMLIIKNNKRRFIPVLAMFIVIGLFYSNVMGDSSVADSKPLVSVDNNQIVYNGKILTNDNEVKYLPVISPDNSCIVFAYKIDLKKDKWGKIGVYNLNNDTLVEIPLAENFANAITNLEWVTDKKVAVTGHRNPSLSSYEIYNITTKLRENVYYGSGFSWDKEKKHLIIQ